MKLPRPLSLVLLLPIFYALASNGDAQLDLTGNSDFADEYTIKILKILRNVELTRVTIPQIVISSPIEKGELPFLPPTPSGAATRKTTIYRLDPPPSDNEGPQKVSGPLICEVNDPPYAGNGENVAYKRISTPLYTVTLNQKTVDLDPPDGVRPTVAQALELFEGRGPERLIRFRAFASGKLVSFQGRTELGNRVLGQVDPKYGYLTTNWAEWRRLKDGSTVMSEFRFAQFRQAKPGLWFPTKISAYVQAGRREGSGLQYGEYTIDSFTFHAPPLSLFSLQLAHSGLPVNDNRYGPTIRWAPPELKILERPGRPVTPELLGRLTQGKIVTYSKFVAAEAMNRKARKGADARLIVLIAAASTAFALWFLSHFGRRKRTLPDSAFARPRET